MRQCTNEKEGDYGYGIADDRGNACSASDRMSVDSSSQEAEAGVECCFCSARNYDSACRGIYFHGQ